MSYINNSNINELIKRALAEDIGKGDITVRLFITKAKTVQAVILASSQGIICGIEVARLVFKTQDPKIRFKPRVKDGSQVKKGQIIADINGKASSILTAERVALNFLGLLSGIATRTSAFCRKIKNYKIKIMDTRKTLPGLRELQKYAVKTGGGYNHRFKLDEMVLIKDNHIKVMGNNIKNLKSRIKRNMHAGKKIEIEVGNLKEFKVALGANPDIIMLDNMKVACVRKAVIIRRNKQGAAHKTLLEASGSVNINNVRAFARSGVDVISLGTLTKDIKSLDLSLEVTRSI